MKPFCSVFPIAAAIVIAGVPTARAHVSVGGDRTLNSGNPIDGLTVTNNVRTVSSSFGWADGTDDNWGDSHRLTAFKFTLASAQTVSITVQRNDVVTQTGNFGLLFPAFSLFTTPLFRSSTHDTSVNTRAYLTGLFGNSAVGESFTDTGSYVGGVWQAGTLNGTWDVGESFVDANGNGVYDGAGIDGSGKKGAFRALDPWTIYVDAIDGLPMHMDTIIGHAADGTAANYGSASGINGDGHAEGTVTATFDLAAGDYYIFAGGANYSAQATEAPIYGTTTSSYPTYGIAVTVTAVPEPGSATLLGLSLGALAFTRRRQNHRRP